ncbi:MAG: 50S ribosomal protein L9 [Candidatus Gracilibacteria bacterium]|nr:50S ribosomal protein L9 [Candidatus Gracilibacteria bacterium]
MKLILLADVQKVGRKNQIIEVKAGYARNFLLPKGLAAVATPTLMKQAEAAKAQALEFKAKIAEEAKQIAQKLKDLKITVQKKATNKGSLYAAVSESEIVELLEKETQIKLDPSMLKLPEVIKKAGEYKIEIELSKDTTGHFKLVVKS